ncbi:MAG: prepilin peptidase [Candidatus Sericytochromatia bacterium]
MNLISEIHPTYYILIIIISIALYTDATKYKIYNWLTFPSLFLGFIASFFNGVGFFNSFIGFLIAFSISFAMYATKGIKAGDVKLMASIGAWLGNSLIITNLLYIFISGGILGILFALKNGTLIPTLNKIYRFFFALFSSGMDAKEEVRETINKPMPYGLAIFVGTILTLIYPNFVFKI